MKTLSRNSTKFFCYNVYMENALFKYFDELVENSDYRKIKQQGFGKNIKSWICSGKRYVDINGEILEATNCKTFHDFLFYFFEFIFDKNWLKDPKNINHPLSIWYHIKNEFISRQRVNPQGFYKTPCTGAVMALLRLSYNLYLLAHNVELQSRLINRLKQIDQFQGAYYETCVAAYLIYSGFDIAIEDEKNGRTKHHDYVVTVQETGIKYAVEVKLCSKKNVLGASQGNETAKAVGDHLYKALSKPTDKKRIIFIEMNTDDTNWYNEVSKILNQKEISLTIIGKPAPKAYLFLTNINYHYHLNDTDYRFDNIFTGFKIDDFHQNLQIYKDILDFELKHIDCLELFLDVQNFEKPSTFNGENPNIEFAINKVNGVINEFIKHQENIGQKSAFEMYNFYYQCYRNSTKEKLLEFIDPANQYPEIKNFSQERLAKLYCRILSFYGRF